MGVTSNFSTFNELHLRHFHHFIIRLFVVFFATFVIKWNSFGDHALHHLFPTFRILPELYDVFFRTFIEIRSRVSMASTRCYPIYVYWDFCVGHSNYNSFFSVANRMIGVSIRSIQLLIDKNYAEILFLLLQISAIMHFIIYSQHLITVFYLNYTMIFSKLYWNSKRNVDAIHGSLRQSKGNSNNWQEPNQWKWTRMKNTYWSMANKWNRNEDVNYKRFFFLFNS